MSIDDCISEYETLGDRVFGRPRWFHIRSPMFYARDKYSTEALEDVLKDVVSRRVLGEPHFPGGKNFAYDDRCKVVVTSYQKSNIGGVNKPYLFRSYANTHQNVYVDHDRNPSPAHDIPIWQVARATCAAPAYFKPAMIDGQEYLDGGFGTNNPCAEIFYEV